jgi:hypothetical protein
MSKFIAITDALLVNVDHIVKAEFPIQAPVRFTLSTGEVVYVDGHRIDLDYKDSAYRIRVEEINRKELEVERKKAFTVYIVVIPNDYRYAYVEAFDNHEDAVNYIKEEAVNGVDTTNAVIHEETFNVKHGHIKHRQMSDMQSENK